MGKVAKILGDTSRSGFNSVLVEGDIAFPLGGIANTKAGLLLNQGDFTFTRAGVQYVLDYDSVWLPLAANEVGFYGARRVKNWFINSESPDNWKDSSSIYLSDSATGATYESVADTDADGNTRRSFKILHTTAKGGPMFFELHSGTVSDIGTILPGTIYTVRYDQKNVSGTAGWDIYHRNWGGNGVTESGNYNYTPTAAWRTYSSAFDQKARYTGFGVTVKSITDGANEGRIAHIQFEDLTGDKNGFSSSEYVASTNVPGIQWFGTDKGTSRTNPSYVANIAGLITQKDPANVASIGGVLTEAVGAALADMRGYMSEPAGTNLCACWNVPNNVGWGKASDATGAGIPILGSSTTARFEAFSNCRINGVLGRIALNGTSVTDSSGGFVTAGFLAGESVYIWRGNESANGEVQGPFLIASAGVAAGTLTLTGAVTTNRALDAAVTTYIMRCPTASDNITLELNEGTWHTTTVNGAVTLPAYNSSASAYAKLPIQVTLSAAPASNGGYVGSDDGASIYYWTAAADFGVLISGGTGPTFKLVSDRQALLDTGLGYANTTGLVYELYGGTSGNATFAFGASGAGTASRDTWLSIYGKKVSGASTPYIQFPSHTGSTNISSTSAYSRYTLQVGNAGGSVNTDSRINVVVQAGVTVRVVLPQLEQSTSTQATTTGMVSSPIITSGASASRTATLLSKAWGSTKNNEIAGSLTWTPLSGALLQKQVLWSLYADASNYLDLSISNGTITFRKRAQAANYDATASYTPVAGTPVDLAFSISSTGGVTLSVNGVAGTPHADTRALALTSAALHQIGSSNGTSQAYGCFKAVTVK